jgi:hypothetical protein
LGPPGLDAVVLVGDGVLEFLVDRDQRFAIRLVVEVAQVGRSVRVTDDAVAWQADVSVIRNPQRIRMRVINR